jgi:hypothetical protein
MRAVSARPTTRGEMRTRRRSLTRVKKKAAEGCLSANAQALTVAAPDLDNRGSSLIVRQPGKSGGSDPAAGDPLEGLPSSEPAGPCPLIANLNVSHYLSGGQCFGPFMARKFDTGRERSA